MNVLVTGSSGFLGRALVSRLTSHGHHVASLRRVNTIPVEPPSWNPDTGEVRLDPAALLDSVVHLAGENIAQRWTTAARARIRASRVDATRLLCETLARLPRPPRVLVCASATGYYGDRGEETLSEGSAPGTGFLSEVCQAWEAAAAPARERGIRVVHLRFGIVLARRGGALARMLPVFRAGLGGRLGSGRQYWSWIALEDALGVVELSLRNDRLVGPINAVTASCTNAAFTSALARALHRPAVVPVPAFAVKALFGAMGQEALLASTRVQPDRLLGAGFEFRFPDLAAAFKEVAT
jgi:uncharacterized protein